MRARMLVVRDVCEIACGPGHLLALVHLTRKRVLYPGHKMSFVGQICDDDGHVASSFQSNQCTTNTRLSSSDKVTATSKGNQP